MGERKAIAVLAHLPALKFSSLPFNERETITHSMTFRDYPFYHE
jgi:hypothetical protein